MFKKLFSNTKGSVHVKKNQDSSTSPEKLPESLAGQVVNSDSERQLFRFKMPTQERGMTDLIDSHQSGNRFQYVALTGSDVEDHSSRIRRLIQHSPRISKSEIPLSDLPKIRLFKDMERFPLDQILPKKGKEFINLNKATIVFTPLTSFADDYSVMKCSLMDTRMRTRIERSSVKANTNIQAKIEFSMDHCLPRDAASQVFLVFNREIANMNAGNMWGVVQVQMEIIESDLPFMENMREVVAVLTLPSAGLDTFEKDPMNLDITMHNNHRERLQDLYAMGEVADETEPMHEKTKKITYAKSSAAGSKMLISKSQGMVDVPMKQSQSSGGDWSFMSAPRRNQISDDLASISAEDDEDADSDSSYNRIRDVVKTTPTPAFESDDEDVEDLFPDKKSVSLKSAMKKKATFSDHVKVSEV